MINIFDLAGYTPNIFESEPLNIYSSINTILFEKPENDCNNPIFHAEPEVPKPSVEYYWQSALSRELLMIDDPVFKDHLKEYHSCADEWDCCCKDDDETEWCYCDNNKSSEKCSLW
jgi:hypothetical protein